MPTPDPIRNDSKAAEIDVPLLLRDAFAGEPQPQAGFRAAVWARIDVHNQPATWGQWLRGHAVGTATAVALCALVAGAGGGWVAYERNSTLRQEQLQRYLVSIDAHLRLESEPASGSGSGTATTMRQ